MAKSIRTIKADFRRDEKLGNVSRDARYLFVLLITYADDHGRFRAHPSLLRGELYPYDDDVNKAKIERWLGELRATGRVQIYRAEGQEYGVITNWSKHQRVDNASRSELPDPTDGEEVEETATDSGDRRTAANLGELPLERKGKDRRGVGGEKENVAAAAAANEVIASTLTAVWNTWRTSRRSGRANCERAVAKALKAGHDPEAIIDGARRWAAHYDAEQTADNYVPMLTTWLNDERWLMDCPQPRMAHPAVPAQPRLSQSEAVYARFKASQQARPQQAQIIELPAIGSGT